MFKTVVYIIAALAIAAISFVIYVVLGVSPVSSNGEIKSFEVKSGSSYLTISKQLKDSKLIRSEFLYKIYVKAKNPTPIQACTYQLKESMNLDEVLTELSKDCLRNPDAVKVTIPENYTLEELATAVSKVTDHTKESLLKDWDNKEFVQGLIEKYWFLTDDILNKQIIHPLEGYFFPSTYEFANKEVDSTYIAYKFLDQMNVVLSKHKDKILAHKLSIHELMTFANIVEYEGITKEERHMVAGVFQNRLNIKMQLQSCATLAYALGYKKVIYSWAETQVDSPYNSYKVTKLPIGPGGLFGEESLVAVLNPTKHDYLYFQADVYGDSKTYYAKTLSEHEAITKMLREKRN